MMPPSPIPARRRGCGDDAVQIDGINTRQGGGVGGRIVHPGDRRDDGSL
jgi:hypothetical protein